MSRPIGSAWLLGAAFAAVLGACAGGSEGAADSAAALDSAAQPTIGPAPGDTTATAAAPADGAMIDPNAATRDQLMAVQGMTAPAADALVAGRPFADMVAVDQALRQHVADSAARKAIYARVWRPLDLNSAKGEEILLIPGVGNRMRHEFEEYRPYRDMAQFRREIGKYVDSAEVARLERYVRIGQ